MSNDDFNPPGGQAAIIELPDFKKWRSTSFYDYENLVEDYDSLEALNHTTRQARLAIFKVTDAINKYEREEKTAKLNYDREHRRAFLASTAKTAAERTANADLKCEELENEYVFKQQLKDELIRLSHTLRIELQTLQSLGNNLRQQLKA